MQAVLRTACIRHAFSDAFGILPARLDLEGDADTVPAVATASTAIEWTEATWNPVTGCSKVSPGCAHCYAEALSRRFRWTAKPWTPDNAEVNVRLRRERLDQPLRWKRPRVIFVNSMSDLFHELVPVDYVREVFGVMAAAEQHVFQILTKRHERLAEVAGFLDWPPNVWMGVSVENNRWAERADALRSVPAGVRFISAEPLLGPLDRLDLSGIDWLIAGGESGPGHRPVREEWLVDLRDRCAASGVAFFFKQWGGRTSKVGGRELDGREWSEMPGSAVALA
ncbi:MAG TPA: phage Gp37/Gp68 family protein [Burkholderiales bacterium]|nr:phage Gp37/Gp68 family protein [Burkholderiales bacterium]